MQAGIAHIKKELTGIYPATEIDALASLVLQHIKLYTRTQMLLAAANCFPAANDKNWKKLLYA